MRRAGSELDRVARRLYELASLIGVSEQELLAFMKVLSRADWANVEFRPIDGVEFEIESFSDGQIKLEITVKRDRTTIIKEYDVPDVLVKGDISEVSLCPPPPDMPPPGRRKARRRRGRRRKPRRGSSANR